MIIGVCIVLVGGLQNLVCSLFDITSHFIVDRKWYVFYWFIIMFIMLSNEDITESFLGRKQITKDNNHSFFVYILHFIILKSIIVVFFHLFIQNITFSCSVLFATILCMLITFIFAKIFSLCFMFAKKSINKLVIRGERI